ncbi:MAG: hypothetical protein P4L69_07120 [Desulfosporosinus sp.]|nr:hypothetical protein [Desulfosporosinus sp.]
MPHEHKHPKKTAEKHQEKKKTYKVIADNLDMIPEDMRVALCKSCQKEKGQKMALVADKSQLVCFLARKTFAIRGPCSGCGKDRWAFVKKPAGY